MERNLDIGCFHPSVAIGGFFETGHFAAVMVLSGVDKRGASSRDSWVPVSSQV
jgi:hypothetical protein